MIAAAVIQPATGMNSSIPARTPSTIAFGKTQDEHRDRTIFERESAKNYLRANVVLQHEV